MKFVITTVVFFFSSIFAGSVAATEFQSSEQLEQWFSDELQSDEERALAVNEGELVFLSDPPEKAVHHIQNILTISDSVDSLVNGWVNLFQCHDNLDAVAASQIVYRYKRMRHLTVDSFEKIRRAWVEGNSVQLEDVEKGARLCVRADVGILYSNKDGSAVLKNGPFHRKFLDGYYPMHVSLRVQYPDNVLRFENISPKVQPGFGVTKSKNTLEVDAWFEGELKTEVKFSAIPRHQNLNQIMTDIGRTMVEIYPLVVAKRVLKKPEIKTIDNALTKLANLFAAAEPFIDKKSDGYQVSYEFVSQYLKVVQSVLETQHIDYARSHLYALGEVCTTCHTQDSTLRTLFSGTTRNHFNSDFAYAEFNYMTRNYAEAVRYYEKHLTSHQEKTELAIIQPLQRIITIYTQVNNKPAKGIAILKKYLSLNDHTMDTEIQLKNWITGLEQLNKSGLINDKPVTFEMLKNYTYQYLGDLDNLNIEITSNAKQEVQRVWLRGQLYHYLNSNPPASEVPMILYWLAVADRSIAYNFYFSMTDLYLKQCVLKYPQHNYAHRCYREYREYMDYTYTRNGEPIPEGIKKELMELKMKLSEKSK